MTSLLVINGYYQLHAQNVTDRIALYVKVWGFLKYHHPDVAAGPIDWDSVFVAGIEPIINARSSAGFNEGLSALITAAGPDNNTQADEPAGDIFAKNHDLLWIRNAPGLDKDNRQRLLFIYRHRNRGANRYVRYNNFTDYSGEKAYADMPWPTSEYRLLFLARFWNAIQYFDPYKFMAAQHWDSVLTEFIPRVRNVSDPLAYHKMLLELAVILHDGHAQLISNDDIWGNYSLPVYITIAKDTVIINHLADDSLCHLAGIKKGDLIFAINGEPVSNRISRFSRYTTSSNAQSLNRHLEYTLLCTRDTIQQVTIRRGRTVFTTKLKCIPVNQRSWRYINNYTSNDSGYKAIGRSIAYVYTMNIWGRNVDTIKAFISSKKAVIFDARNYTQNDAFYNIFDMFLTHPAPINYSTYIMPDDPGYFKWQLSPNLGGANAHPYNGSVIILADERCQSQGEYSVMALQTIPNSITIGSPTCGVDGTVSSIPMGGGLAITHSGYGIYYPDKRPTQQCGIRIDVTVKKNVKNIINDEDPALQKALDYLRKKGID